MAIKNYDELNSLELDTLREVGSIGTGNAATSLSQMLGREVRITLPDGYVSEFDRALDVLFRTQTPERVLFGLDLNILVRDDRGVSGALPEYLYNENPLDDLKYLLNKDTLYYSVYVLLENLF